MNITTFGTTSSNRIAGSPVLEAYDFRAFSFYDGRMFLTTMAGKIADDMRFEEKLKKLHEEKMSRKKVSR